MFYKAYKSSLMLMSLVSQKLSLKCCYPAGGQFLIGLYVVIVIKNLLCNLLFWTKQPWIYHRHFPKLIELPRRRMTLSPNQPWASYFGSGLLDTRFFRVWGVLNYWIIEFLDSAMHKWTRLRKRSSQLSKLRFTRFSLD